MSINVYLLKYFLTTQWKEKQIDVEIKRLTPSEAQPILAKPFELNVNSLVLLNSNWRGSQSHHTTGKIRRMEAS